jgi:hypothetical protein
MEGVEEGGRGPADSSIHRDIDNGDSRSLLMDDNVERTDDKAHHNIHKTTSPRTKPDPVPPEGEGLENKNEQDVGYAEAAIVPENQASPETQALHYGTVLSLCICMLTYSYLVISVFPYSGFMAINLITSANKDNAGSYAGLLASCFHFGIVMTAVCWGRAADVYGRKTVLILALSLCCFLTILFGLAPSFVFALVVRFSL